MTEIGLPIAMRARRKRTSPRAHTDRTSHPPAVDQADTEKSNDLAKRLGANVRRLRMRRGFSLSRFAEICGVSRAMLGQIENGKSSPTIVVASKIADALLVPIQELVDGGGSPTIKISRRGEPDESRHRHPQRRNLNLTEIPGIVLQEHRVPTGCSVSAGDNDDRTHIVQVIVAHGAIVIAIGQQSPIELQEGDCIAIHGHSAHLRNASDHEVVLYFLAAPAP